MISVCMATYNGARFIKQQIDSILPQLSENDELIVSDDGSTDGTLEIIATYNDKRIKVFHHEKKLHNDRYKNFRYVTENFENALKQAQGDYIFLSDQDDVWMPDKVERCIGLLAKYDCVVHNYAIIDTQSNIIKECNFSQNPLHKSVCQNLLDDHFRGCCMAFKAHWLKTILPIPQNIIAHDFWIGLFFIYYNNIGYELKPLTKSRWYNDSVSSKKRRSILYKLIYRLHLNIELYKRIYAIRKRKHS